MKTKKAEKFNSWIWVSPKKFDDRVTLDFTCDCEDWAASETWPTTISFKDIVNENIPNCPFCANKLYFESAFVCIDKVIK